MDLDRPKCSEFYVFVYSEAPNLSTSKVQYIGTKGKKLQNIPVLINVMHSRSVTSIRRLLDMEAQSV